MEKTLLQILATRVGDLSRAEVERLVNEINRSFVAGAVTFYEMLQIEPPSRAGAEFEVTGRGDAPGLPVSFRISLEVASDYGRLGYEAYCAASGGRSLVSGQLLPTWDETTETIREAWRAAGAAVSALSRKAYPAVDLLGDLSKAAIEGEKSDAPAVTEVQPVEQPVEGAGVRRDAAQSGPGRRPKGRAATAGN